MVLPSIRPSFLAVFGAFVLAAPLVAQTIRVENPDISATEERPDYLQFKEATLNRTGKHSIEVDVVLGGKIPGNMVDKFSFYLGFDVDDSAGTGSTAANSKGFGQDIGVWITKDRRTNRFEASSGILNYRGKNHDIAVTQLKVSDDKISFKLRSELFGYWDHVKFFFSSSLIRYDGETKISDTQVDLLPRKGTRTL